MSVLRHGIRRRSFLLGLALTLSALVAPIAATAAKEKGESKPEDKVKEKMVLGFVPLIEQEKLIDSVKPLSALLSKETGSTVEAFASSNYVGVVEALGSGKVDFAIIPPLAYVLAHKENQAELLLSAVNKEGKSSYRSEFVVTKDSEIKTIGDLKGKRVGFVDPASSSGYIYPAAYLKKHGFNLEKDINTIFCGGHDAAIEQLLQGDVDVACCYDDARKKMCKDTPNVMDDTRILDYSDDIPYIALVASSKLNDASKKAIKEAFLKNFNKGEGQKLLADLFNLYGFKESKDSDYDSIRRVAESMDIKLDE